MKRLIFVIAILLCLELALSKSTDKIKQHRKKTTSIKKKPTSQKTSSKSLANLDIFKTLPTDDIEFIKDLDKQFKLHGDKVKIKIERASSNTTKNSKRTIDGDLGYGYQNPHHRYQFSPPKYVIYPYSQRDIPPIPIHQRSNHHRSRTEISIEPSHAFELKEIPNYPRNHQLFTPAYHQSQNDDGYRPYQHHQQIHEQPQTIAVEPVIVLRIPGPTKYAAHLQALLQQYLELRAAHYIKLLQESEVQQYSHQQGQIIHQQPDYPTQPEYQPQYEVPQNHDHHQNQPQHQPEQHQSQPEYQPAEQVYEQVSHHQAEQGQSQQPQQEQERFHIQYENQQPHIEEQPAPAQDEEQPPPPPAQDEEQHHQQHHHHEPQQTIPTAPQYVYEQRSEQVAQHHDAPSVSYQYIQEPIFVPQSQHFMRHRIYGAPHHSRLSTPGYLPPPPPTRKALLKQGSHEHISENNPRHTHTKVIFTDGENNDHSISYPLASITPAPRKYTPSPTERYNHHTLHYDEGSSPQHYEYQNNDSEITITQRPFNYHAHAVRQAGSLKAKKRATSVTAEEQFRKLNKLIDRLKKKDE